MTDGKPPSSAALRMPAKPTPPPPSVLLPISSTRRKIVIGYPEKHTAVTYSPRECHCEQRRTVLWPVTNPIRIAYDFRQAIYALHCTVITKSLRDKNTVKPLYNVPLYNVFHPIAFKMFGPGKLP